MPTKYFLSSFIASFSSLCSLPMVVLVAVASLDSADKQLLSSSFPALERTLNLDVKQLGYFTLFTDLSYALSLPFWGYLVHKLGLKNIFRLLSIACASWGFATVGIAILKTSFIGQAAMRSLNGWMLGSILPLSQTLLVELVPEQMRGRAFGVMTVMERLAGTGATISALHFEDDWEIPYYYLGIISLILGCLVNRHLDPNNITYIQTRQTIDEEVKLTLRQIMRRISKIQAFRYLVAQGIFGGTPWSMMSFQLLLLDWRGFDTEQIVTIQVISGLAGTIGAGVGGFFGDYAAIKNHTIGRVIVALISVLGGIPIYGMFLFSTKFETSLCFIAMFHALASWVPAAAIRPICADLTRNASERAQIVSMWLVLEKISAAILGAPLVGYLTSKMLDSHKSMTEKNHSNEDKANVLAFQLFFLCSLFWIICSFFWILMALSLKKGLKRNNGNEVYDSLLKRNTELVH